MASGAKRWRQSRSTANGRAETRRACAVRPSFLPSSHVTTRLLRASGNFDPFTQHLSVASLENIGNLQRTFKTAAPVGCVFVARCYAQLIYNGVRKTF